MSYLGQEIGKLGFGLMRLPQNDGISGTMEALNSYILYDSVDVAKHDEGWLVRGHGYQHPTECIKCGACKAGCPVNAIKEG
jgi:NAD-dependent dihydropyrimidine dehydrogenase PreA subunit